MKRGFIIGIGVVIVAILIAASSKVWLGAKRQPAATATSWESGMTIVTQADQNKTVRFVPHERFLIQFGDALRWSFSFAPSGTITSVPNSTTTGGFQGVYEAIKSGTTVLHAEGRPICRSEMCAQFIEEVTINFVTQ